MSFNVMFISNARRHAAVWMAVLLACMPLMNASVLAQTADSQLSPRSTLAFPSDVNVLHAQRLQLADLDRIIAREVYFEREYVSVAVYDPTTNSMYSGGKAGAIGGASLTKLLLAIIAFKQAEQRGASEAEIESLRWEMQPMLAYSDNDIANEIWGRIGGAEGVTTFLDDQQLTGFRVTHPFDWGKLSASASDWAMLLGLLGSGKLLNARDAHNLLAMMDATIEDHRWGVLRPAEGRLSLGKNGWYDDHEGVYDWRVTSVGFVTIHPGEDGIPRVVAVLTRYPIPMGMNFGVTIADRITDRVATCAVSDCGTPAENERMFAILKRIW